MNNFSKDILLKLKLVLMPLALLALLGCHDILYSNLEEKDINEMMAILMEEGIDCKKVVGTENRWSIMVDNDDISKSMQILKKFGLPREKFKSIGDVFEKGGLISSPSEERIRFIYALSQEVSETISRIDGVITARVQIVLPNNNPFKEAVIPSSASVFIKHRKDVDMTDQILKIKELVIKSIEGLSFKNVTVALFPAEKDQYAQASMPFVTVYGIKLAPESALIVKRAIGLSITGLTAVLILMAFRVIGKKNFKRKMNSLNHRLKQKSK